MTASAPAQPRPTKRTRLAKIPIGAAVDLHVTLAPSQSGGVVDLRVYRYGQDGYWTNKAVAIPLADVPELITVLQQAAGKFPAGSHEHGGASFLRA